MRKIFILLVFLLGLCAHAAAPMIWENGNYGKMLTKLGFHLFDDKAYRSLVVDPTAGGGVAANIGSLGLRDNAGVGEAWFKFGAADTAWVNILFGNTGWQLLGNAATDDTINFLGTTDAENLVVKTNGFTQLTFDKAGGWVSNQSVVPVDGVTPVQYNLLTTVDPGVATTTARSAGVHGEMQYDNANSGFSYGGSLTANSFRFTNSGTGTVNYSSIMDNSATFAGVAGHTNLFKGNNLDVSIGSGYAIDTYAGVNSYLTSNTNAFDGMDLFNSNANITDSTGNNVNGLDSVINLDGATALTQSANGLQSSINFNNSASASGSASGSFSINLNNTSTITTADGIRSNVNVKDTANVSGAVTGSSIGISADNSSVINDINIITADGTVQGSATVTNYSGAQISPAIQGTATATNLTGISVSPQVNGSATVTNPVVGISSNVSSTTAINGATAISADVSSATVTDPFQKIVFSGSGGSFGSSYSYTIPGSTTFFQTNYLGGQETVSLGNPIAAFGFGDSFAHTIDFQDDWTPDASGVRLGFVSVGFVGSVIGAAGKTMDSWTGALSGANNPSGAGTIDQTIMFRAAGILPQGGALAVNNMYGFQGMTTLCSVATNCWGSYIADTAADNWFAKDVVVDGATSKPSNASVGLELAGTTKAFLQSRLTTTERNALTPLDGMTIFNTTTNTIQAYYSGTWNDLGSGGSSALTDSHIFVGNASNVATDVAMSGDVGIANTGATTIQNNVVTNAKLAQMAAHTIKGNNTGSTANASDLTGTQVTAELDNFVGDSGAGGTKGLVPAPAAGDAAAGKYLKADGTWTFQTAAIATPAVFVDQQTSGTNGGSSVANGVQTRVLNTQINSVLTPWAVLASNQVTLAAGTYYFDGRTPALFTAGHQAQIYDVTNAAVALYGSTAYTANGSSAYVTDSRVTGTVVILSPTVYELRQYTNLAVGGAGLGTAGNGPVEQYSSLSIWKIQ